MNHQQLWFKQHFFWVLNNRKWKLSQQKRIMTINQGDHHRDNRDKLSTMGFVGWIDEFLWEWVKPFKGPGARRFCSSLVLTIHFLGMSNLTVQGFSGVWMLGIFREVQMIVWNTLSYDQWPWLRNLKWRYLPYIRPTKGLCKGISPQNMALYGTNVPPFWDPGDLPLIWYSTVSLVPTYD